MKRIGKLCWVTALCLVLTGVMLTGCRAGGDGFFNGPIQDSDLYEPELELPETTEAEEPEPEEEEAEDTDPYGLVWLVQPTLEYDHVVYCAYCDFFAVDDHSGSPLDRETGEPSGEDPFWGHGGHGGLAYDPERDVFGWLDLGETVLLSSDEFLAQYSTTGLQAVVQVDSSMREGFEGVEWLAPEAFMDRYAVMYNGVFVTDFLFDDRDLMSAHAGNDAISMGKEGRWGLIDRQGNMVIPFIFEHIVHDNNVAFARYDGKYGILDIRALG